MCPGRCLSILFRSTLILGFVCVAYLGYAQDVWSSPALSTDPQALRKAAAEVKPEKDAEATILLSEYNISFDSAGKMVKKRHLIYRVETQDGVQGWAEVRGNWEPWYQAKPEIKARVITSDGAVHVLDPKTLNDIPVHENTPDVYSDERAYGGPLPALAPGAISEEEVTTTDTALFFPAGIVETFLIGRSVAVYKTRFVISHPESLPLHYRLQLMPEAVVKKSTTGCIETILIEQGPLPAYTDNPSYVPPEAVLDPRLEISTGSSWHEVAATYFRQVQEKLRISDVQPMISRLDLKKGSNLDAIRRIVAALHNTVRYTGVEFGESNLIPQFPGETLKRKYGDCKDKSALLVAMLSAAGIPANVALLATGPGQDIDPDMPGMGAFDHAIVYVPATASSPELWLDATAEYSRVGDLPSSVYGRWALIADEKTSSLKRIPELTSEKNQRIETREFTLADYGPAKIVEKDEQFGPTDALYRDYYDGDPKKIRENGEKYVKDTYLADSLTSLDKTDPTDLNKPFVLTFAAKGRRGFTEIENSQVYIPYAAIFDDLPNFFLTKEEKNEEKNKEESDDPTSKPRTVDWVITPFVTEWHYKITVPPGFKLRALPAIKDELLGTAHFSQKYSSNQDGTVVEAVLRFDSGKGRLTVQEANALRDAIVNARAADGISISFDQIGYSLLSAGKIKEALSLDRQLVADHPREALHRVRLALALLSAGLGEKARAMMKEAAALDPKSPQVFEYQGWILEHDPIGRLRAKGFDYDGALAAFRKAKQLDPKVKAARADLAILLEYDADGVRYGKNAHLDEAIAEFNGLKKLDESYARSYEDYVPYDLWYLGKVSELKEHLSGLPGSETRKSFSVAIVALTDGTDAAIKKSLELASDEETRSKILYNAGWMLLRKRKYPQAAELLASSAHGQKNETRVLPFVAMLKKMKPGEEVKIDESTPAGVIQRLFALIFAEKPDFVSVKKLMCKALLQATDNKDDSKEYEKFLFTMRSIAERSGLSMQFLGDQVASNARYTSEGDDTAGYKVTVESPGAEAKDAFVVREDDKYRIVDFYGGTKTSPDGMGWEALALLESKEQTKARRWLDWAREKVHINEGDDPLSGQPFPHFWTKGQEADEATIRVAAMMLLAAKDLKGPYLNAMVDARNNATSDAVRTNLNLVLARAYAAQQQWPELLAVAEELMKVSPDSYTAFQFAIAAYAGLKRFEQGEKLVQARLQKYPDEPDYIRSAAQLARNRGDFGKALEILKSLIDRGRANANDLNLYAWDALFIPGKVDQDALDAAHRSNDLTKNSNFAILHTLACLYAATGKTKEARELLLKAMEEGGLGEPDSAIWLGLATIAEQYGEIEAARAMYARVEKPTNDSANSNYALAQIHLAALQNGATSAKAAGQ